MNYPLISEYIDAIKNAEDNFNELTNLRPVYTDEGEITMSSGNYAVVFKMTDGEKCYAVKCFTKEQKGRERAYNQICNSLNGIESSYLVAISYHDAELYVDSNQTDETEFPIVLMEWIEGVPLDIYVQKYKGNPFELYELCYKFRLMCKWLIEQKFAHGDIKPDNILVKENGNLVLIDYDGMFVSEMHDTASRECGTPEYTNPFYPRIYNSHIDDYPLALISLSLKLISISYDIQAKYDNGNGLLFSEWDILHIEDSELFTFVRSLILKESQLGGYYATFIKALSNNKLQSQDFDCSEEVPLLHLLEYWPRLVYIDNERKLKEGELDDSGIIYSKDGRGVIGFDKNTEYNGEDIHLKDGVICIYENAFDSFTPKLKLFLPKSLRYFNSKSLNDRYEMLSWESPWYVYDNGYIYTKDYTEAILWHDKLKNINSKVKIIGAYLYAGKLFNDSWPSNLKKIRNGAFNGASVPNSLSIPEGVVEIEKSAFSGCDAINVQLPASLQYLGSWCFHLCEKLNAVYFANGCQVHEIKESTFCNCKQLSSIVFPSNLNIIGDSSFLWCENIKDLFLPQTLKTIGKEAFGMKSHFGDDCNSKIENIIFPKELKIISESAFSGCNHLENIVFTSKKVIIEKDAFKDCPKLNSIQYNSIEFIGESAFRGCVIDFHSLNKVRFITPGALFGCKISSIGDSDYIVESNALYSKNHKELIYYWGTDTTFKLHEGVKTIKKDAFLNIPNVIILPNSFDENNIDEACFVSVLVVPFFFSNANYETEEHTILSYENVYVDDYGVVYSEDKHVLKRYSLGLPMKEYTVSKECEIIDDFAFGMFYDPDPEFGLSYRGNKLEQLILPDGLRVIGIGALNGCINLKSLEIPNTVVEIRDNAFDLCERLHHITLPKSLNRLGDNVFAECI